MENFHKLDALLPRYLRRSLNLLDEPSLGGDGGLLEVPWLPGFFALPGDRSLRTLTNDAGEDYKAQGLFPMDAASAIAVHALDLSSAAPLRVLDLCCSPGSKLMLIAEQLHKESSLVGVDISMDRLYVCRSLLEQWLQRLPADMPRLLVYRADGQLFPRNATLVVDSQYLSQAFAEDSSKGHKGRRNKSARAREAAHLLTAAQHLAGSDMLFDRVLVDTECTHDASYRHMKFSSQSRKWPSRTPSGVAEEAQGVQQLTMSHNIPCTPSAEEEEEELSASKLRLLGLQRQLLRNGFRQLAVGGVLVYSTCSADESQCEAAVRWLLEHEPSAKIMPIAPAQQTAGDEEVLQQIAALAAPHGTPEGVRHEQEDERKTKRPRLLDEQLSDSERMCRLVCRLSALPLRPSALLPDTVRLGALQGMSGHFIAKLTKLPS